MVGFLIAHGYANAEQKDDLVNAFADIIGTALIFITSLVSLAHVWEQRHISKGLQSSTPSLTPSTEPLPSSEQETSSNKLFSHHVE